MISLDQRVDISRDILVLQARHRTPGDYLISLDQRVDILERYLFSKLDKDSWRLFVKFDRRVDILERYLFSKLDKDSRR